MISPIGIITHTGPSDPSFANVVSLVHGDESVGATTFFDKSPNLRTLSTFGNTVISTTQAKWNGRSIKFDGTGDYLTQDFTEVGLAAATAATMECWAYCTNSTGVVYIGSVGDNITNCKWSMGISNTNFFNRFSNTTTTYQTYGTAADNAWHHFAITIDTSHNLRAWVDGTEVSLGSSPSAAGSCNAFLSIGTTYQDRDTTTAGKFPGYINDFRYTKGVLRYTTSTFSVPTAPFPQQ